MPAPTKPHSELIIEAVMAALKKINLADGYFTEPKLVQRYSRNTRDTTDRPVLIVMEGMESRELRGGSSDFWDSDLAIHVTAIVDPAEEEPQTGPYTDELVARLKADMLRVLGNEVDWDGLRARFKRVEARNFILDDDEDPEDGTSFYVIVEYSHSIKDPSVALAPS
mgnify:CR=1 FL=1